MIELSPPEARVLGSLLEKDLATPEYYPLSLNALVLACNQKTNREPVSAYSEEEVREIVEGLRQRGLVEQSRDARVPKYGHLLGPRLNLGRGELALLAVMLLRGPQTLNELRERTARMHDFDDVDGIVSALRRMPDGMVIELPKRPGWKELRWAQLLTGEPAIPDTPGGGSSTETSPSDRIVRLEEEVSRLRAEFEQLRRKLGDL